MIKEWKEKIRIKFKKWKHDVISDKRIFAKGLSPEKLFFIFILGSMIGTYYEQFLNWAKHFFKDGRVVWELRRGVIYGPFNPLYGACLVCMTVALMKKKRPWYLTFLYSSLLGGAFEYIVSWLQEIVVGTTSWNYTGYFLNIGGRTTIPFMIFWGLGGILFTYVIYPWVSNFIERVPYRIGMFWTKFLMIFLCFDCLISWTALYRQTQRREGKEPVTAVGKVYDNIYTDEFLKNYYPNMKPAEKKK